MNDRQYVDKVTPENWRTSVTSRAHAGMWMGAHVRRHLGHPGQVGYTVDFDTLEDALQWVNREPQPYAVIEIQLPDGAEDVGADT